ncbi:MAG: hypothetical protein MJ252_12275 [archaeon]|nr:hypothetical protein [archaeon]
MDQDIKALLIPKIRNATQSLKSKNHPRVNISDFSSIQLKQIGNTFAFYHPVYTNVK